MKIPLERISYDDLLKLSIEQNTQLFVKGKEIERLNKELDKTRLSELDKEYRISKAIEYLESYNTDFKNCRFGEAPISIRELGDLLDILKGVDKE